MLLSPAFIKVFSHRLNEKCFKLNVKSPHLCSLCMFSQLNNSLSPESTWYQIRIICVISPVCFQCHCSMGMVIRNCGMASMGLPWMSLVFCYMFFTCLCDQNGECRSEEVVPHVSWMCLIFHSWLVNPLTSAAASDPPFKSADIGEFGNCSLIGCFWYVWIMRCFLFPNLVWASAVFLCTK